MGVALAELDAWARMTRLPGRSILILGALLAANSRYDPCDRRFGPPGLGALTTSVATARSAHPESADVQFENLKSLSFVYRSSLGTSSPRISIDRRSANHRGQNLLRKRERSGDIKSWVRAVEVIRSSFLPTPLHAESGFV